MSVKQRVVVLIFVESQTLREKHKSGSLLVHLLPDPPFQYTTVAPG